MGAKWGVNPLAEGIGFAAKVWGERYAVDVQIFGQFDSGDFTNGGQDIGDVHEFHGFALWFYDAGAACDKGDAGAHFCGLAFAVSTSAVVADKDDQRIFAKAKFFETANDATDAFVHVFHIGLPVLLGVSWFFRERRVLVGSGPEGRVGKSHGVVDEKGFLFVVGHEIDDKIDEHVGSVTFGGSGDMPAVADDGRMPEASGFAGVVFPHSGVFGTGWEIVFVGPHHVVIEAGFMDKSWMFAGELPFPGVGGCVSGVLENLAEGRVVGNVVSSFVGNGRTAGAIGEMVDSVIVRILSRHDGKAGGMTDGVGISGGEVDPLLSERVEVWGLVDGMAIDAQFVSADVVSEDHDDVGSFGRRSVRACGVADVEAMGEGEQGAGGEEEAELFDHETVHGLRWIGVSIRWSKFSRP